MNIREYVIEKVPNLHESLLQELILEIEGVYPCKIKELHKLLKNFREKYNIIAVGRNVKRYWLDRGWSLEEAIELINKHKLDLSNFSSAMTIKHWTSRINTKTGKLFTIEEAKYKIKSQRKLNVEYWLERNYTEEESKLKVKEYQAENSKKFTDKLKRSPEKYEDRTSTQIKYWIKKGFSLSEAKIKLKERQQTNTLENFIRIYGIHGEINHLILCDKISFCGTRQFYVQKYGIDQGNIIFNKKNSHNTYVSKESLKYFIPLYKRLRKLGLNREDIYWGISGSKEYWLSGDDNIFFYDFVIPKLNKIIEYNGIAWHPNPNWSKKRLISWKPPFKSQLTASDKIAFDNYKELFAKERGFDVLNIWSDELLPIDTILTFIGKIV